jgi:hypothetical protein
VYTPLLVFTPFVYRVPSLSNINDNIPSWIRQATLAENSTTHANSSAMHTDCDSEAVQKGG